VQDAGGWSRGSWRQLGGHPGGSIQNLWVGIPGKFGDVFQIESEAEPLSADANDIAVCEGDVSRDFLLADAGAIAAAMIAESPFAGGAEDFAVIAAARIIVEDEAVVG
jgi:hypothetical protein